MEQRKNILSAEKRLELLAQHRKERDRKVGDRLKAVLLSDDGWTPPQIAHALFIDEGTIRRHLEIYEKEERLRSNHKGTKPLLNEEETKTLSLHLESKIYVKIKGIQAYVRETFHKELGISTLYDWLKREGFSYKKPKLMPKNVDLAKQQAFIKAYGKLMTEASLEGDPVLFGDSVHPTQQTRASYGWIKRGKDMPLETTGARKRINLMGVFNLESTRFDYQDFETINGASAVAFLKKIEKAYPKAKKIHLIWDQAGYHTAKEVKAFLETSRIEVHHLPPRSPNLNPIERLWKIMHEYVSNNRVYDKFKDFKESLFAFFDHTLPCIRDVLISRITDNFQILIPAK